MTPPIVHIVATPGTPALRLVQPVDAGAPCVGDASPTRWLLLAGNPARGLAQALADDPDTDAERWLDAWLQSARALLRQARQLRGTSLLLDADEALADLPLLQATLAERLGAQVAVVEPETEPSRPPIDALHRALAQAHCDANAACTAVYAELHASTTPLASGRPSPDGFEAPASRAGARMAPSQWLAVLRELQASGRRAEHWQREAAVAGQRHAAAAQSLQAAQAELARHQEAQSATAARVAELERASEAGRRAEAEARAALQSAAERATQAEGRERQRASEVERLQATLRRAQEDLQRAERALETARQQFARELRAEREQHAALAQSAEEARFTLVQLHQAQEQLEILYEENLALRAKPAASTPAPASDLATTPLRDGPTLQGVAIQAERNGPPYRELTLELRGWRWGARRIATSTVRLVEHHGRPGLVLIDGGADQRILDGWVENGREGDLPYLRLVPDDASCQRVLHAMSASDWQRVRWIADRIEQHLSGCAVASVGPEWRNLARRLVHALEDVPACARFDEVGIQPEPSGTPTRMRVQLRGIDWKGRRIPRLEVIWQPHGAGASISLRNDPEHGPPLPAWPLDDDGQALAALDLPIGPDSTAVDKRSRWRALPDADRRFLAALLARWPEALASASAAADDVAAAHGLADDVNAVVASLEAPSGRSRGVLRRAVRLIATPAARAA